MPKIKNPFQAEQPETPATSFEAPQRTPEEIARAHMLFMADDLLAMGVGRDVIEPLLVKRGIDPEEYFGPAPAPPEPEYLVRLATEADEPALMDFCRVMHADNGICSFSELKVLAHIQHATQRKGSIIGVIDGPNGFEASIYLTLTQLYYSDDTILAERWLFVHPDHRAKGHFDRIVDYARSCQTAMSKGGPFMPMVLGIVTMKQAQAKIRLFAKKFPVVGAMFAWTQPDSNSG